MNNHNHEGRPVLTAKIDEQISWLTTVVQNEIKNNLSTRNVVAETILAGLLNRIHGWNLINANRIRANYPAVDLVDPEKRVAVQVSSTCDLGKVDHTLEEFTKNHLEKEYDRLYVLLISTANSTETMQKRTIPGIFSGKESIWNMPKLTGQLMDLDIGVLEDIQRYLTLELGRFDPLGRYLHLPAPGSLGDGFLGRQEELESIRQQLNLGIKPVVLRGLGGMGKTVLATEYSRKHCQGMVYFAHFQESFTETARNMYQGVHPRTKDAPRDQEKLDTVLQLLERCTEDDLLIIDNVDSGNGTLADLLKDTVYKQLQQMKLRLLITTRFEYRGAIQINRLDDDALYRIFRRHESPVTKQEMDALIRAVSGHTLAIDLIARTLADNWVPVSSEEMLDALEKNTLSDADFAEIDADYGNSPEQKQIYQHLRAVFNVAKIPEEERTILHYATLLPADGMDLRLFRDCIGKELLKAFPMLGKRGWLISDGQLLQIHPVVRMVCIAELKPTDESCGGFLLRALLKQYDPNRYDAEKYRQCAGLLSQAAALLEDKVVDWAFFAGIFWKKIGQPGNALEHEKQTVLRLERSQPDSPVLAAAYNNLGTTYGELGDHKKELEYQLKALEIREKVLPTDHTSLATSYNDVGIAYGHLGDHNKELEFQLKALAIYEKMLPADHTSLAASYNNVGGSYGHLGDHNKELEFQLKALAIWEKVLPADHPDLATSYNNVGGSYGHLGEHQKALEYLLKALEIREKVLPADHPDLATSYNNVGTTYGHLGDHQKALEFQLKALEILEKVLPADHPHLAASFNNVGITYGHLGDHQKALEFKLKALKIREKALPPDHPDLAASYNNVGCTYGEMGDHKQALEYLLKALEIREKVLPPDHPDLASSYNNVGCTYGEMGKWEQALYYLRKAIIIFEKKYTKNDKRTQSVQLFIQEYQKQLQMQ